LIQNTNDFTLTGDLTTNILGQDPLLGPLQDNGGPTLTHALLPGSPAIDQGSSGGLTSDQRGLTRVLDLPEITHVDDGADIGAAEALQESDRSVWTSNALEPERRLATSHVVLEARGDESSLAFSLVYPTAW